MTRMLTAVFLLAMVASVAIAQDMGHAKNWIADYDKAMEIAKKENKDLLVDFTGSDWCHWCIILNKEVFDHEEFLTAIKKDYVLVALDFPRGDDAKAKVPNAARNDELQKKHNITGFPSVLLINHNGEVFGRTGYQEGGPANYLKHLKEISTTGKKTLSDHKKVGSEFAAAKTDEEKIAVAKRAIDMVAELNSGVVGYSVIAAVAKQAFVLDPKNEKGLKEKAVLALLKSGGADNSVMEMTKAIDPKNEKGLYEQTVASIARNVNNQDQLKAAAAAVDALYEMGKIKDKRLDEYLSINAAFWHHRYLKNPKAAKKYAKHVMAISGEKLNPRYKQLVDMILKSDEGK